MIYFVAWFFFNNFAANKPEKQAYFEMKKFLSALAAIFLAIPSSAQMTSGDFTVDESTLYYGVRIGINVSTISGDGPGSELGSKAGLNFGGIIGFRLSDTTPIFLESGLYYSQLGAEKNKNEVNLNYLEIPILIKAGFHATDQIALLPFIGPVFGYGIAGKTKGYDENHIFQSHSSYERDKDFRPTNCNDKYLHPDVGIKVGCAGEWNMLYLELGYRFGVANILNNDEFAEHNNTLFINFGVNF